MTFFSFEIEHIFNRGLWRIPRIRDFLNDNKYLENGSANQIGLFSDELLVEQIQNLPDDDPLKQALLDPDSGFGTNRHRGAGPGGNQFGKRNFLIEEIDAIRNSNSSPAAQRLALDNLFDWTYRWARGEILDPSTGRPLTIIGNGDLAGQFVEAYRNGPQAGHIPPEAFDDPGHPDRAAADAFQNRNDRAPTPTDGSNLSTDDAREARSNQLSETLERRGVTLPDDAEAARAANDGTAAGRNAALGNAVDAAGNRSGVFDNIDRYSRIGEGGQIERAFTPRGAPPPEGAGWESQANSNQRRPSLVDAARRNGQRINGIIDSVLGDPANLIKPGVLSEQGLARLRAAVRAAGVAGLALAIFDSVTTGQKIGDLINEGRTQEAQNEAAGLVGRLTGGLYGAKIGLQAGAALAPLLGPVGPFAPLIGLFVGGALGALVGDAVLRDFSQWLGDIFGEEFFNSDPLVLDLDLGGTELTSLPGSTTFFDLDSDGFAERTGWVKAGDALLALDANGDGIINNGSELFGTPTVDGFTILAQYDDNGDGVISGLDPIWDQLLIWRDTNLDGISAPEELTAISDGDILSINLDDRAPQAGERFRAGNLILGISTFTQTAPAENGVQSGDAGDDAEAVAEREVIAVGFATNQTETRFILPEGFEFDPEVYSLPNLRGYGQVPDLWVAMSLDPVLKQMVQDFVATVGDAPSVSSLIGSEFITSTPDRYGTLNGRRVLVRRGKVMYHYEASAFEDILAQWAGAPIVAGRFNELQAELTAEAFLGREISDELRNSDVGRGRGNPNFHRAFTIFSTELATRFVTGLAEIQENQPAFDLLDDLLDANIGDGQSLDADSIDAIVQQAVDGFQEPDPLPTLLANSTFLDYDFAADEITGDVAAFIDAELEAFDFNPESPWDGYNEWLIQRSIVLNIVDDSGDILDERLRALSGNRMLPGIRGQFNEITGDAGDNVLEGEDDTNFFTSTTGLFGRTTRTAVVTPDVLIGGQGNDTLIGGLGNDTYVFQDGSGNDTVIDTNGAADEVAFQGSLTSDLAQYRLVGDRLRDLEITFAGRDERVVIADYLDDAGKATIETISFADGISTSERTLRDLGYASLATDGDDLIRGTDEGETIIGGDGDDVLLTASITSRSTALKDDPFDDVLIGGRGDDRLIGNAEYQIARGDGNDEIFANEGGIVFGFDITPDDIIVEQAANRQDILLRVAGEDQTILIERALSQEFTVNSTFDIGSATDISVQFADGTLWTASDLRDFATTGTEGDDTLFASPAEGSLLTGLGGNDRLVGRGRDDTLIGGLGDDTLIGGFGNNEFRFSLGDGNDSVELAFRSSQQDFIPLFNAIRFDETIARADISVRQAGAQAGELGRNTVILSVGSDDQSITVTNFLSNVENISVVFSDGTALSGEEVFALSIAENTGDDIFYTPTIGGEIAGGLGNDQLNGQAGDDRLFGEGGNDRIQGSLGDDLLDGGEGDDRLEGGSGEDTLIGGIGDDTLVGGSGVDTYVFARGDGSDFVQAGSEDLLDFQDIARSEITLSASSDATGLILSINGSQQSVEIGNAVAFESLASVSVKTLGGISSTLGELIDELTIATDQADTLVGSYRDQTLDAQQGDDRVRGGVGAEVIMGGLGDDVMSGGLGDDVFVFNIGDGNDQIIVDPDRIQTNLDADVLEFGVGIALDDISVSFAQNGSAVILSVGSAGDSVTIDLDASLLRANGLFRFADGTQLTAIDILSSSEASGNDDILFAAPEGSTLNGLAGNDILNGGASADVLIGGTGNDQLVGGAQVDTYRFDQGDGEDVIIDTAERITRVLVSVVDTSGNTLGSQIIERNTDALPFLATLGVDTSSGILRNEIFPEVGPPFSSRSAIEVEIETDGTVIDVSSQFAGPNENLLSNKIVLGAGLNPEDAFFVRSVDPLTGADQLELRFRNSSDRIAIRDSASSGPAVDGPSVDDPGEVFNAWFTRPVVDEITFADGTVWGVDDFMARKIEGQVIGDRLIGTINNELVNSPPNDDLLDTKGLFSFVEGLGGTDTFIYNRGYGSLTIDQTQRPGGFSFPDQSTLLFGPDISVDDVFVSATLAGDLVLSLGDGDEITLLRGIVDAPELPQYPQTSFSGVLNFQFADGTILRFDDLDTPTLLGDSETSVLESGNFKAILDPAGLSQEVRVNGSASLSKYQKGYGAVRFVIGSSRASSLDDRNRFSFEDLESSDQDPFPGEGLGITRILPFGGGDLPGGENGGATAFSTGIGLEPPVPPQDDVPTIFNLSGPILELGAGLDFENAALRIVDDSTLVIDFGDGDRLEIVGALDDEPFGGLTRSFDHIILPDRGLISSTDLIRQVNEETVRAAEQGEANSGVLLGSERFGLFDTKGVVDTVVTGGGFNIVAYRRGYGAITVDASEPSDGHTVNIFFDSENSGIAEGDYRIIEDANGNFVFDFGDGDSITVIAPTGDGTTPITPPSGIGIGTEPDPVTFIVNLAFGPADGPDSSSFDITEFSLDDLAGVAEANDAVEIGQSSNSVTELVPSADGNDGIAALSTLGFVEFSDANAMDSHSVSVADIRAIGDAAGLPAEEVLRQWFTTSVTRQVTDGVDGEARWIFSAPAEIFAYLGENETVTLEYDLVVDDNVGGQSIQTITVNIAGTNDTPAITGGITSASIAPSEANGLTQGSLTFTDSDLSDVHSVAVDAVSVAGSPGVLPADDVLLSWLAVEQPVATEPGIGSVAWSFSAGDFDFSALGASDFVGLSFEVTITDTQGATATQLVQINITAATRATAALFRLDNPPVTEDTEVFLTLPDGAFGNFLDGELSFTATLADGTALPDWLVFDGETFIGTPPQNFTGNIAIQVIANNGTASASDVFTLTVEPVNDAPVVESFLSDRSLAAGEQVDFLIAGNTFSDVDDDSLLLTANLADGGSLPDWLSFDGLRFSGTAPTDFSGVIEISLTATDGSLSAQQSFNLAVDVNNNAPSILAPLVDFEFDEDTQILIEIPEGTFEDIDGDTLTLSASLANGDPLPGALVFDGSSLTGTPPQDFNGSFTIAITASDGSQSATSTFELFINPVGEAPQLDQGLADVAFAEDAAIEFEVPADAFSDPDGDPLSFKAALSDGSPLPDWLSFDGISFTGTPPQDFNGALELTVTASDGSLEVQDSFTLTIDPVADAPESVADSFVTEEDTALQIAAAELVGNDTDVDSTDLSLVALQNAVGGVVSLENGVVTFTPNADFFGTASFEYLVTDGDTDPVVGTATVEVTPVNDAVRTGSDSFDTDEDVAINLAPADFLANDVDPEGGAISITSVTALTEGASAVIEADGSITLTPPADAFGLIRFEYVVTDDEGLESTGQVSLFATSVNDAPVLVNELADQSSPEEASFSFAIDQATFADVDDSMLSLTASLADGTPLPEWMAFDGVDLTGTPPQHFNGSLEITVTASDGEFSASDTLALTIDSVNDAPMLLQVLPDIASPEDTAFSFGIPDGSFVDVDGDALTLSAALEDGSPLPDWLSFDGNTFTATPPQDFNGLLALAVTASDGELSASDTFTLMIDPVNDAPVLVQALADVSSAEDTAVSILLPQDTFADVDGDALTVTATLADGSDLPDWLAFHGATFTGTPPQDFNGALDLTVTASDGELTADAAFTLTVDPVNDAPVLTQALADVSSDEDAAISLALPADAFADVDGDALTLSATLSDGTPLPTWLNFDGATFTGTPPQDFNGAFDLTVTVTDGEFSVSDSFTLTIDPVNDAPTFVQATQDVEANVGDALSIDFANGVFADVDGDALTFNASLSDGSPLPSWLTFTGGILVSDSVPAEAGDYAISVTASDGQASVSDSFVLTVIGGNTAPVAQDDGIFVTTANRTLAIDPNTLFENDVDAQGDALTLVSVQDASIGEVSVDTDGNIIYIPDAVYVGDATFTYTVTDGEFTSTATVTIDIDPSDAFDGFRQGNDNNNFLFGSLFGRNRIFGAGGNDLIVGGIANDELAGGDGNDDIFGSLGNDDLYGGQGDDTLYGGFGFDTAHLLGDRDDYQIFTSGGFFNVTQTVDLNTAVDGDDGVDTLISIEQLEFKDGVTLNIASPIILDLAGDGVQTVSADESDALFDLDDDGLADNTSWIGTNDAFLFLDRDGNGTVSGVQEISFIDDVEDAASDLEGLRAFDSNGDGVLNSDDERFDEFGVWNDADGDGAVDEGETATLREVGIASVGLDGTPVEAMTQFGEIAIANTGSYTLTNGTTRDFADAALTFFSAATNLPELDTTSYDFDRKAKKYRIHISGGVAAVDRKRRRSGVDSFAGQLGANTVITTKKGDYGRFAPVVLDLDGDGVEMVRMKRSNARFDYAGDGRSDQTGWLSGDDGFLVIDRNNDGLITEASELSLASEDEDARTGLQGLAKMDSNGDGVVNASDARFSELRVWQDRNGNGRTDAGELMTLEEAGIVSISLAATGLDDRVKLDRNAVTATTSFTRSNGTISTAADVSLAYRPATAPIGQSAFNPGSIFGSDLFLRNAGAPQLPQELPALEDLFDQLRTDQFDSGSELFNRFAQPQREIDIAGRLEVSELVQSSAAPVTQDRPHERVLLSNVEGATGYQTRPRAEQYLERFVAGRPSIIQGENALAVTDADNASIAPANDQAELSRRLMMIRQEMNAFGVNGSAETERLRSDAPDYLHFYA